MTGLSNSVAAINLANKSVSTVNIGVGSSFLAITPDSSQVWVGRTAGGNTLFIINTANNSVSSMTVGTNPSGIAITSDNTQVWEANSGDNTIGIVNRATQSVIQTLVLLPGSLPVGMAITPDQAPTARFTETVNGQTITFDGSSSTSPYGGIATYAWNFGDGTTQTTTTPQVSHTYSGNGTFTVTLTVTNTQGTSTIQTFTGQTVSNNGAPSATTSQQVTIAFAVSSFKGKPKIIRKDKKLLLKTRWTQSADPTVARYKIFAHKKKIESISVNEKRKHTIRLHPQHSPRKHLSHKYKRYLEHKYSIRAVNVNGVESSPTFVKVIH